MRDRDETTEIAINEQRVEMSGVNLVASTIEPNR